MSESIRLPEIMQKAVRHVGCINEFATFLRRLTNLHDLIRSLIGNLIVLLFLSGVGNVWAQSTQPLEPKERPPDWERYTAEVPVSGGLRVGFMNDTDGKIQDPRVVYALIPSSRPTSLCVEISSQDGRYSANLEYDLSNTDSGWQSLRVPTEKRSELSGYDRDGLVVLANLSESCDGSTGTFVVTSWQHRAADDGGKAGEYLYVYLNSRVPTTIVSGVGGQVDNEVRCQKLGDITTAYNLRCAVPTEWVKADTEFFIRMRKGRNVTNIPLPIVIR